MGYYLRAFLGKPEDLRTIAEAYDNARIVDLEQGLSLIPFTDDLYDQINNLESSPNIKTFEFLTANVEDKILKAIIDKPVAYVEADYFGGEGGQQGIVWTEGKRIAQWEYGQDVINAALKHFDVIAKAGMDEFATLGFGRHRNTADWLED